MNQKVIIKKIEKSLFNIFDFKNVMETDLIQKTLNRILELEKDLPQETIEAIDFFIDIYVNPLLSGAQYYNFISLNFGKFKDDKFFEPYSDLSASVMCVFIKGHCCYLQSRLRDYFKNNVYINV